MAKGIFTLRQVNQAIRQDAWTGIYAPKFVEYLVVAGGGSGGVESYQSGTGGGGGAGGLLTGIVPVTAGTSYTVTVGSGGAQVQGTNPGAGSKGNNGTNSIFSSITAIGGGAGSGGSGSGNVGVGSGGSGGGGKGLLPGGSGILGQGNAGGTPAGGGATSGSVNAFWTGSGGGGAGTVGLNSTSDTIGANGGAGIASAISGTVTAYAGGGGSGTQGIATLGGVGGGGSGGRYVNTNAPARNGASNSGGGGGGAGNEYNFTTGAGGSGIVIVRYPGSIQFYTGGAVTYANGHVVHTFYVTDTLAPTTPTALATSDYQISRSIRLNKPDLAFFSRTVGGSGNRKTWTWSGWVKRTSINTSNIETPTIFQASDNSTGTAQFNFGKYGTTSDCLSFDDSSGSTTAAVATSALFRDLSAWYHIVLAYDSTQVTSSDRVKIYVNGTLQEITAGSTYPALNNDSFINFTSYTHRIGAYSSSGQGYQLNAYLAEINFIDGQQLTPSSFGETNSNTGVWQPKAYTGTYGTNGYELNFSDNSNTTAATLGADSSGNGNNWTPNNFSVTAGVGNDSLLDTPTPYGTDTGVGGSVRGNYCTLNPVEAIPGTVTYSNGNLGVVWSSASSTSIAVGTIAVSSGKWYWEVVPVGTLANLIGVANANLSNLAKGGGNAGGYYYYDTAQKYTPTSAGGAYGTSYTTNDVIGVALDMDVGTLTFYKNNVNQGVLDSSLAGLTIQPALQSATSGSGVEFVCNFGQRPFAYTAPSGFKALCTTNLPTPAIGASPTSLASKFFNTVLYTGNSGTNNITGVGFQPDLVWGKSRNAGYNHGLIDSVRGISRWLGSNDTNAEDYSAGGYVTAFNSDGFTAGAGGVFNNTSTTYVAWNWKAGGTAVNNTSGSLTSSVSANPAAGFSIVTYTGNAANAQTIGHGLGVAPSMIIVGARGGGNWPVYHKSLGINQYVFLNSSASFNTVTGYWGTASPTPTVFGVIGGGYGNNSGTAVAYCFAPIEGYSAFGSYAGNSSNQFIYTGFLPKFVMVKIYSSGGGHWTLFDSARSPYNLEALRLQPSTANAEASTGSTGVDMLSNGFRLIGDYAGGDTNLSGYSYIFMAFAENPFKYSLAR